MRIFILLVALALIPGCKLDMKGEGKATGPDGKTSSASGSASGEVTGLNTGGTQ